MLCVFTGDGMGDKEGEPNQQLHFLNHYSLPIKCYRHVQYLNIWWYNKVSFV